MIMASIKGMGINSRWSRRLTRDGHETLQRKKTIRDTETKRHASHEGMYPPRTIQEVESQKKACVPPVNRYEYDFYEMLDIEQGGLQVLLIII